MQKYKCQQWHCSLYFRYHMNINWITNLIKYQGGICEAFGKKFLRYVWKTLNKILIFQNLQDCSNKIKVSNNIKDAETDWDRDIM